MQNTAKVNSIDSIKFKFDLKGSRVSRKVNIVKWTHKSKQANEDNNQRFMS